MLQTIIRRLEETEQELQQAKKELERERTLAKAFQKKSNASEKEVTHMKQQLVGKLHSFKLCSLALMYWIGEHAG